MVTVAQVQAEITRNGHDVTLQRVVTGQAPVAVTVRAVVRGYDTSDLVPGGVQGDRLFIIGNAEISAASWPLPIRKGDRIVSPDGTFTVQGCNTVRLGTAIAKHEIVGRG